MIYFRQVNKPYPTDGIHWQVEYFDETECGGMMFPVGVAYLVAVNNCAQLNSILVADAWRRQGIASPLGVTLTLMAVPLRQFLAFAPPPQ